MISGVLIAYANLICRISLLICRQRGKTVYPSLSRDNFGVTHRLRNANRSPEQILDYEASRSLR